MQTNNVQKTTPTGSSTQLIPACPGELQLKPGYRRRWAGLMADLSSDQDNAATATADVSQSMEVATTRIVDTVDRINSAAVRAVAGVKGIVDTVSSSSAGLANLYQIKFVSTTPVE